MATTMGQTIDRNNRTMSARNYWMIGLAALVLILVLAFAMSANRTDTVNSPASMEPARTMDQINPQNTVTPTNDFDQNTVRDSKQTPPTGP